MARSIAAVAMTYYMLPDTRFKSDHNKVMIFVQVYKKLTFVSKYVIILWDLVGIRKNQKQFS